jgi:hypothetical protein
VHGSPKWHEERPEVLDGQSYTYEARVRLGGGLPNYPQDYYFRWYFEDLNYNEWNPPLGQPPKSGGYPDYWSQQTVSFPSGEDFKQVIVEIYEDAAGEKLVGRDIIYADME